VDVHRGKIIATINAGHTARSPVLSLDGKTLYVCNQFDNDLSVIDLAARQETGRIPVQREPVAADITHDGKYLLVANHLSVDRSDSKNVAAVVSLIDLAAGREVNELNLPVGSEMLKDLRVSPDGKYAVLTHIFCNYDLPTRHVELGLMNANAMTILNLANLEPLYTLLLDEPYRGAGNPWGVAFSADSSTLVVAHAGAREISVIDFPALLAGLPDRNRKAPWPTNLSTAVLKFVPHYEDEELNDGLPFLVGARQRIQLAPDDLGPRAIVISGHTVYTANYFSDTLSAIDLSAPRKHAVSVPLGPKQEMTPARRGEFYFHDAEICYQSWQSCSSCHPGDGRVDALNWDLASEGPGHPKNTSSLLLAGQTEPVMKLANGPRSMGDDMESAVRVAIKTLLFTNLPDHVAEDMDAYINSLKPVPSPYLLHGHLSPAAQAGEAVFNNAGCVNCHVPGLYTDRELHDVGTFTRYDPSQKFRTPSLIEAWRTSPYLHDGSAISIRDVITTRNPGDGRHGDVAALSTEQIDDLCAYVLSL
jgi:YVTN family beta-propeller protein